MDNIVIILKKTDNNVSYLHTNMKCTWNTFDINMCTR